MGAGDHFSSRPALETNNFRLTPHLWARDLSCPCCGQLKISGVLVERLEIMAVMIGRTPNIHLGYLCHVMARNWSRTHRKVESSHSRRTGVRRIEARLPVSGVELYKGTAVLLRDTSTVIDIAHRLGFESHLFDEGTLIVLAEPSPVYN